MPQTQKLLFDAGITFSRAYVTTPACCPSRASIFTGLQAGHHGVLNNNYRLKRKTFMRRLADSGYYVGLIGKYLNTASGTPYNEMSYWVSFKGGKVDYYNPRLNVNGKWKNHKGYVTHILGDYAVEFLGKARDQQRPFALVFTPNSPHGPSYPAVEDSQKYTELAPYSSPAHVGGRSDKPGWLQRLRLSQKKKKRLGGYPVQQLRCLASLDNTVARILNTLHALNMERNTIVFYISDNGVMWGEYGLNRKDVAYEPAVHVPFAIRYPEKIFNPRIESALVANIDIAPTIYDLAQVEHGKLDGVSLAPLFEATPSSFKNRAILLDGYGNFFDKRPPFFAYLRGRTKFIQTRRFSTELYDLVNDPYEMVNLSRDKRYESQVLEAKRQLRIYSRKFRRANSKYLLRSGNALKSPTGVFRKRSNRKKSKTLHT